MAGKGSAALPYARLLILFVALLAGCAGQTPRGTGSAEPGYVIVQRGDTLSAIARRAGIPLLRLERFNPGVDARDLAIGQRLMLPGQNERAPGSGQYRYEVRRGDSIGRIARRFDTSTSRIMAANRGLDADRLQIGQLITVPVRDAPSPGAGTTAGPAPAASLPPDAGPWAWPVQRPEVVREFGPDERDTLQPMLVNAGGDQRARAVAPGTVRFAGTMRQLGGVIIVHHAQNLQSVYAYCDRLMVDDGRRVETGTPLCEVRRTDSGHHSLLFDVRLAGRPFNPRQIIQ